MDTSLLSLIFSVVIKYAPTLIKEVIEILKKKGIEDSDFDKILARLDKKLHDKD